MRVIKEIGLWYVCIQSIPKRNHRSNNSKADFPKMFQSPMDSRIWNFMFSRKKKENEIEFGNECIG